MSKAGKLKLLQQRVSRKRIGSNNWKKALHKVATEHEYVANCRKDWHRKLSHQICDNAGMVFVEDLNLVGLSGGMLAKHCLDAGFGQFFNILEQTCFKRDVYFQKVDSRKTSQICPNCGVETGKKQLSERTHKCTNCGYTTDRDVAAAQIVAIRGLAAVGQTLKMHEQGVNLLESPRSRSVPEGLSKNPPAHLSVGSVKTPNPPQCDGRKQTRKTPLHSTLDLEMYYLPHNKALELPFC